MRIDATGTFSKEDGTLQIDLEFHPATPLEHEIVAEFVRHPKRTLIVPTAMKPVKDEKTGVVTMTRVPADELEGDVLHARLTLDDEDAFDAATHNLENRRRASEGLPSLESEAERKEMAEKAAQEAEESSKASAEQTEKERLESRKRIEEMAAKEIADRYVKEHQTPAPAQPEQKPAEAPKAKEPDKVQ